MGFGSNFDLEFIVKKKINYEQQIIEPTDENKKYIVKLNSISGSIPKGMITCKECMENVFCAKPRETKCPKCRGEYFEYAVLKRFELIPIKEAIEKKKLDKTVQGCSDDVFILDGIEICKYLTPATKERIIRIRDYINRDYEGIEKVLFFLYVYKMREEYEKYVKVINEKASGIELSKSRTNLYELIGGTCRIFKERKTKNENSYTGFFSNMINFYAQSFGRKLNNNEKTETYFRSLIEKHNITDQMEVLKFFQKVGK